MAKVLLINGPNLNLLGKREPEIYGSDTLADIESRLQAQASAQGHELACFQSNTEGAIVDRIQAAQKEGVAWIIINAGALTHTSVALQDALAATAIPFIEVHISNVHAREAFRHQSYLSALASGIIVGLGTQGYELAMDAVARQISQSS
jgi:3-dehydroquinate dehydratase-2